MNKRVGFVLALASASCAPGNQTGPGMQKQAENRMQAAAAAPSPVVAPNELLGSSYDEYVHLECKIENETLVCDVFERYSDAQGVNHLLKIKEENISKDSFQQLQIASKEGEIHYLPVSKTQDTNGNFRILVKYQGENSDVFNLSSTGSH